jgi:DNA-binding transcriptional MerR regulator
MQNEIRHFSKPQTAAITGLSEWQINYIIRTELIIPAIRSNPGRGRRTLFSYTNLIQLRCLKEILAAGIAIKGLTKAIRKNRALLARLGGTESNIGYLITDGTDLYLYQSDTSLHRLTASDGQQLSFGFLIDLRKVTETVVINIRKPQAMPRYSARTASQSPKRQ